MSNLQKFKQVDLIDKLNDTARYLDDIFTTDNRNLPCIFLIFQLNKANTSDKETHFLDLNINVIGSNMHTSVYDKCDDLRFPIINFPWFRVDVPRLLSSGIDITQ